MAASRQIGFNPNHGNTSKPGKNNPFQNFNWKNFFKKWYAYFCKLIRALVKVITGALLCIVVFHFVPELREYIPSLESFSQWILKSAEWIFSFVVEFLVC